MGFGFEGLEILGRHLRHVDQFLDTLERKRH